MEHTQRKQRYADVLSAVVLFGWIGVSVGADSESPAKDDYQIFIQKGSDSTPDFFYAFHKTNITGGTVDSEESSTLYQELQDKRKEVSLDMFPALKRSASLSDRATKFTRLFVSKNATALLQVLNNQADSQQKKLVVSAKVPQIARGYCTGSITFLVSQKEGKLSIKVSDLRKCMRSGSGDARLARTAERERKQQQAREAREAQTNIAHLKSRIRIGNQERAQDQKHIQDLVVQLNLETAAAKEAQQEVDKKKKELRELKNQASSAATNAQSVVEDLMDAGIDQEAALRGKQAEALELDRKAFLLEQQLGEAQRVAQQATEREQKAKQELEEERAKSLGKRIGEAAREKVASVKNRFARGNRQAGEDFVVGPTTTNVEPQYPGNE